MIDRNLELDQFPQLSNRGVIQIVPKQLFADWFNYAYNDGVNYFYHNLEPISFLIEDFETRKEFDYWLEGNYQLLFEIRLNYVCLDKSQWPENRTFPVFLSWFEIYYSSMILDLMSEPIKVI
jgi:hypothetical protein